jgi:probable addiction module antidote protein
MFRDDPAFATAYLNHVLLEGNSEDLLLALRYMSEAFGGVPRLAEGAGLNPKTLYRTLSARGNPELRSLSALLRAMGMTLAVQPLAGPSARARTGARRT